MSRIKNPHELYKHLRKNNCGECRVPSCLAFAVAVVQGQKQLRDCPYLDNQVLVGFEGGHAERQPPENNQEQAIRALREKIGQVDFAAAPARLGAKLTDRGLAITCLGKDFVIDRAGTMVSECHVNSWIHIPLLHYILYGQGLAVRGDWVSFGELPGAGQWGRFFAHRCEEALRQLVDAHPALIFEILAIFQAEELTGRSSADYALLIRPLPKVPFVVNYWRPEDGFASKLNIVFDRTAAANATPEALYLLSRGLVEMFRQLIVRHSRDGKLFF